MLTDCVLSVLAHLWPLSSGIGVEMVVGGFFLSPVEIKQKHKHCHFTVVVGLYAIRLSETLVKCFTQERDSTAVMKHVCTTLYATCDSPNSEVMMKDE